MVRSINKAFERFRYERSELFNKLSLVKKGIDYSKVNKLDWTHIPNYNIIDKYKK